MINRRTLIAFISLLAGASAVAKMPLSTAEAATEAKTGRFVERHDLVRIYEPTAQEREAAAGGDGAVLMARCKRPRGSMRAVDRRDGRLVLDRQAVCGYADGDNYVWLRVTSRLSDVR